MKQERNKPCACGSGKKYKKCCLITERENARLAEIAWKERMVERAAAVQRKREESLAQMSGRCRSRFAASPAITSVLMLAAMGSMGGAGLNPLGFSRPRKTYPTKP